ncbi:MAG: MarR family transcriptional regulator [Bacilli bacterium]
MTEKDYLDDQVRASFILMGRFMMGPHPRNVIGYGQGQMRIIYYLSQHDDKAYPNELASFLQVGTGRIGNVLKDMEKKKVIKRTSDPQDKRKTIVTMTEYGKKFATDRINQFREVIGPVIMRFGIDKFKLYLSLANEMLDTADEIRKENEHVQNVQES